MADVANRPGAVTRPDFDAAARVLGDRVRREVLLAASTTLRVGGRAALLFRVNDPDELFDIRAAVQRFGLDVLCVGQGSNLLIADEGFAGLVLEFAGLFEEITVRGSTVTAGAAVKLPVLARKTAAAGLTGLEWAVGVPGSVGGAVAMNAGGHGSDVGANLHHVRVIDLRGAGPIEERSVSDLDLAYRHSAIGSKEVVLDATFELQPGDRSRSEVEISEIVRWRREHQPGGSNCGSVFTNPPGDSAGRLIDQAGLRGARLGSASVSEKHANFIQADESALAADIWSLIQHVRDEVYRVSGVLLQPEVRTVGLAALLHPSRRAAELERPNDHASAP